MLFLSTIFTGAVSYVVFYVGSRVLTTVDMATFVTLWAVANTALLALTLPADTYAPRFRLECTTHDVNDSDRLFALSTYSFSTGALVGIVPILILSLGLLNIDAWGALAISLFGLASAFFASRRAFITSNGQFTLYLLQTVVLAFIGLGGLFVVLRVDAHHQAWLYIPLSLANVVAALVVSPRRRLHTGHIRRRILHLRPFIREIDALPTLMRLIVVTLIAVVLSNGSVMVARAIGTSPTTLVAYAAAVNLVLIPCTLLNSFSGPIHIRFVQSVLEGEYSTIRRHYFLAILYYIMFVTCLAFASYFFLSFAIGTYVGSEYSLTPIACFGIAIAEGMATVTALPRALLIALRESRLVTPIWLVGLAAFGLVMILPIEPLARLVLAPGVAATTILVTATVRIESALATAASASAQT